MTKRFLKRLDGYRTAKMALSEPSGDEAATGTRFAHTFQLGDVVAIKQESVYHNKKAIVRGKVVAVNPRFVTLSTGRYNVTINLADLHCGHAEIIAGEK